MYIGLHSPLSTLLIKIPLPLCGPPPLAGEATVHNDIISHTNSSHRSAVPLPLAGEATECLQLHSTLSKLRS